MPRTRVVQVRKKPKDWSVGVFVAACMWLIGEAAWDLGYSIPWLVLTLFVSFWVDKLCTGKTSTTGVYIE